ncbi:hypothetical protein BaRGS_00024274, partial [Batillaria attramentaria]
SHHATFVLQDDTSTKDDIEPDVTNPIMTSKTRSPFKLTQRDLSETSTLLVQGAEAESDCRLYFVILDG